MDKNLFSNKDHWVYSKATHTTKNQSSIWLRIIIVLQKKIILLSIGAILKYRHPFLFDIYERHFRDFYCKYIFDFKSCCGRETNFKNSQIAGSAIKNNDKRDIFRRDCRFVKKATLQ